MYIAKKSMNFTRDFFFKSVKVFRHREDLFDPISINDKDGNPVTDDANIITDGESFLRICYPPTNVSTMKGHSNQGTQMKQHHPFWSQK